MDNEHGWTVSLKPIWICLIISAVLLMASYRIVSYYHLTSMGIFYTVFALGIIQAIIQLFFFMHLGLEEGSHWKLITFLFTVLVLIIVVGGTIWIMSNLNYNLMPSM